MKRFEIAISDTAYADASELACFIEDLSSTDASDKYMQGLDDTIEKLSYCAGAVGKNEYVQKMFGANARHIVYKKMAIIFFVEDETVYVIRIIAGSLIH
jgi:plasmid stabilization system protein ParE